TLRKARPQTPIVLVEDRSFANAAVLASLRRHQADSRAMLEKAYQKMSAEGVVSLHYLPGGKLLGEDGEATVDGSHPTDLGFARQADAMQPLLASLLPPPAPKRPAIEGYTDRLSYQAGDEIGFHISSASEKFSLEVARVGAERVVVWKRDG